MGTSSAFLGIDCFLNSTSTSIALHHVELKLVAEMMMASASSHVKLRLIGRLFDVQMMARRFDRHQS
jgi:hypothetical protein